MGRRRSAATTGTDAGVHPRIGDRTPVRDSKLAAHGDQPELADDARAAPSARRESRSCGADSRARGGASAVVAAAISVAVRSAALARQARRSGAVLVQAAEIDPRYY